MESEIIWITPLLMLPGIATLIISTSARYTTLHEEIHHIIHTPDEAPALNSAHLITRAIHFRNALVSQYIGVFLMVAASLIGAVFEVMQANGEALVLVVLTAGVSVIAYSTFELIRESRFSLEIIRSHMTQIQIKQEKT